MLAWRPASSIAEELTALADAMVARLAGQLPRASRFLAQIRRG
jgi:hypothetical protein